MMYRSLPPKHEPSEPISQALWPSLAVVVSVPSTYDTSHTKVPWESIIRATFGTIEGQHPGDPSEYVRGNAYPSFSSKRLYRSHVV